MDKQRAIIYGIGHLYKEMEKQIFEIYEVVAKADKNVNIPENLISIEDAIIIPYDKIVVMIKNIRECFNVISMLLNKYHVPYHKIVLGLNFQEKKGCDGLEIDSKGNIIFKTGNISVITQNMDEFCNIEEIFCGNCYGYFLNDLSGDIVLDIGMNVGGASLYFLKNDNVLKVYGFEPFSETFAQAKENFEKNGFVGHERLEIFSYGLSDVNEIRNVTYNKSMTCGQSTDSEINKKARENYQIWELISNNDDEVVQVEVRDIAEIMVKIYERHKSENIILKLDCEGEEYRIMNRLDAVQLLNRITVIMLEWHYGREDKLIEILRRNQYIYWSFRHGSGMGGLIYAVKRDMQIN